MSVCNIRLKKKYNLKSVLVVLVCVVDFVYQVAKRKVIVAVKPGKVSQLL